MNNIEISNDRVSIFQALKHLIVGGNVLLFVSKDGRVFPLSQYVIDRDPMGNVLEIITKETVKHKVHYQKKFKIKFQNINPDEDDSRTCDLYTCIKRENKFQVSQEVKGIVIPESIGSYDF